MRSPAVAPDLRGDLVHHLLGAAIRRLQVESRLREHVMALQAAQAASHESGEQLRALTENLPAGMVYQIAMRRDGSDRRFTYVSRSCARLTGVTAEAARMTGGAGDPNDGAQVRLR